MRESALVPDIYALQETLSHKLTNSMTARLSITTGPSRTADIERVLTIGVHGPKELHLLVIEGE
jgi:L-lactate dehydrogenase complex protein LldG